METWVSCAYGDQGLVAGSLAVDEIRHAGAGQLQVMGGRRAVFGRPGGALGGPPAGDGAPWMTRREGPASHYIFFSRLLSSALTGAWNRPADRGAEILTAPA